MIFAIAERTGLPIRFIGVGEQVEDLEAFEARRYVEALVTGPGGGPGWQPGWRPEWRPEWRPGHRSAPARARARAG